MERKFYVSFDAYYVKLRDLEKLVKVSIDYVDGKVYVD